MLTIICGEDSSTSREYFLQLKKTYLDKKFELMDIEPLRMGEIYSWLSESTSLFATEKVFATQNLNKKISKKTTIKLIKTLEKIATDKTIDVIDWEEGVPSRYLKFGLGSRIKEFKPADSIFKLLDACYPKNRENFLNLLHNLPAKTDEFFVFTMIIRHIRQILLIKLGSSPPKIFSWQLIKLQNQAKLWDKNNLLNFYENLHKLDVSVKTSASPYSIMDTLDIMSVYFL